MDLPTNVDSSCSSRKTYLCMGLMNYLGIYSPCDMQT